MIPAGLYSRVSTSEQAEHGYSIGEQQDRLQKYCDAMGWTVFRSYVDAGFSGANTDRPALQELIRDVRSGKIQKVVVYKLDRLSRSQKDALYLIEDVFLASGCDFVSMSENFDSSTPFGKAALGMIAVFAQLEREQIKERMSMGMAARIKSGKYRGGGNRVPIGYDYRNGVLEVNEFEAMQIRTIYDMYSAGSSPRSIARHLNSSGQIHKYGEWSDAYIRIVLQNPFYLGQQKFRGDWYDANHEPLISQEMFDRCQKVKDQRGTKNAGRESGVVNSYLAGLIFCRKCGSRFERRTLKRKYKDKYYIYPQYACCSRDRRSPKMVKTDERCDAKTWKMDDLDALVFAQIRQLTFDDNFLDQTEKTSPRRSEAVILASEIEKIDAQLLRLMDLYAVGSMPLNLLQEKTEALKQRKDDLQKQIDDIENKALSAPNRRDFAEKVNSFDEVLERGNFDEIRLVLKSLIRRIEIDDDDAYIFWRF